MCVVACAPSMCCSLLLQGCVVLPVATCVAVAFVVRALVSHTLVMGHAAHTPNDIVILGGCWLRRGVSAMACGAARRGQRPDPATNRTSPCGAVPYCTGRLAIKLQPPKMGKAHKHKILDQGV